MTDEERLEQICRTICLNRGQDPDEKLPNRMLKDPANPVLLWETHKTPVGYHLEIREAADREMSGQIEWPEKVTYADICNAAHPINSSAKKQPGVAIRLEDPGTPTINGTYVVMETGAFAAWYPYDPRTGTVGDNFSIIPV